MKWIYYIFRIFFCPHKWKYLGLTDVFDSDDYQEKLPVHQIHRLACRRCGTVKGVRL